MDNKIINFILKQSCMTVCCTNALGFPHCFSCFYVFDENSIGIIFKSATNSDHSKFLENNKQVSGTILPNSLNILSIQGIQFWGEIISLETENSSLVIEKYYRSLPLSKFMKGDIYLIEIEFIKMTMNTMGIQKKISWERDEMKLENLGYVN